MNFSNSTSSHISERLSALGLTRHSFVLCTKCAMWDYFGVSRTEASQSRLRGQRVSTHESFLTSGANVQIQTQVYISERLSALRLIRHSFVLYRKSASVVWKMWMLYINYHLLRLPSDVRLFWYIHNKIQNYTHKINELNFKR
jgi:hypothetical protein